LAAKICGLEPAYVAAVNFSVPVTRNAPAIPLAAVLGPQSPASAKTVSFKTLLDSFETAGGENVSDAEGQKADSQNTKAGKALLELIPEQRPAQKQSLLAIVPSNPEPPQILPEAPPTTRQLGATQPEPAAPAESSQPANEAAELFALEPLPAENTAPSGTAQKHQVSTKPAAGLTAPETRAPKATAAKTTTADAPAARIFEARTAAMTPESGKIASAGSQLIPTSPREIAGLQLPSDSDQPQAAGTFASQSVLEVPVALSGPATQAKNEVPPQDGEAGKLKSKEANCRIDTKSNPTVSSASIEHMELPTPVSAPKEVTSNPAPVPAGAQLSAHLPVQDVLQQPARKTPSQRISTEAKVSTTVSKPASAHTTLPRHQQDAPPAISDTSAQTPAAVAPQAPRHQKMQPSTLTSVATEGVTLAPADSMPQPDPKAPARPAASKPKEVAPRTIPPSHSDTTTAAASKSAEPHLTPASQPKTASSHDNTVQAAPFAPASVPDGTPAAPETTLSGGTVKEPPPTGMRTTVPSLINTAAATQPALTPHVSNFAFEVRMSSDEAPQSYSPQEPAKSAVPLPEPPVAAPIPSAQTEIQPVAVKPVETRVEQPQQPESRVAGNSKHNARTTETTGTADTHDPKDATAPRIKDTDGTITRWNTISAQQTPETSAAPNSPEFADPSHTSESIVARETHLATPDLPKAPASTNILLHLGGGDQSSAAIRIADRAGAVNINVHASDPVVRESLKSNLGELSAQLNQQGWKADVMKPALGAQSESQHDSQTGGQKSSGQQHSFSGDRQGQRERRNNGNNWQQEFDQQTSSGDAPRGGNG
jgi:hypothetical protein